MILQALNEYYHRKSSDSEDQIAPLGFEWKELHFLISVNTEGSFVDLEELFEWKGKHLSGRKTLLPLGVSRSSGVRPDLLWGNGKYILGGKFGQGKELDSFIQEIKTLSKEMPGNKSIKAILSFYEKREHIKALSSPSLADESFLKKALFSFRMDSDSEIVCHKKEIAERLQIRREPFFSLESVKKKNHEKSPLTQCLVTGEEDIASEIHFSYGPGEIRGAHTSGSKLISFNESAYISYGKSQGENAPIGIKAAFTTGIALKHLLRNDSQQHLQVADATTVFWAEREHSAESLLTDLFGQPPKDDPDRNARAVRSLYESPQAGTPPPIFGDDTRFFVLALSPNSARLSVRFWHVDAISELAKKFRHHFEDIAIFHSEKEPEHLSIWQLLVAIALQGKSENIPPNLAGEVMRSILTGTPYPRLLLQTTVGRIQAERHINYPRAAWIKAFLNRYARWHQPNEKEITVSLDENNSNTAYRLGRLFAILEKLQQEALPGISATIRDRYYGSASSTPARAFPSLLKLKNHHLGKLEHQGRAVNFEKMMQNVLQDVSDFPAVLPLEDQGRFALGYYHQRHQLFQKSDSNEKGEE